MARTLFQRAERLIERAQREAARFSGSVRSAADSIEMFDHEAGDDAGNVPIVIAYDWNENNTYDATSRRYVTNPGGRILPNLARHLESLGCDVRWSESAEPCITCGGVITTRPTHMQWRPRHWFVDGEGLECSDCACANPDPYFASIADEYASSFPVDDLDLWGLELDAHGWTLAGSIDVRHYAPPADVQGRAAAKALRKAGLDVIVVRHEASYPVACRLDVWIRDPSK